MTALKNNFNDLRGEALEQAPQVSPVPPPEIDLTAAANEDVFDVLNKGLEGNNIDTVSMMIGDTGNEAALHVIDDRADVTGGGDLDRMPELEKGVDKSLLARQGSLSKNLSDDAQMAQAAGEWNSLERYDLDVPEIREENDVELAITKTVEILQEAGVPDSELNRAMAAGGVDNSFETLDALKDLATDYEVPEAQGYLASVDQDMAQTGIVPVNIAPQMGVTTYPGVAMNDANYTQPLPAAMKV